MNFYIRNAVHDDAEAIAVVHLSSWKNAYTDIIPSDYLEQLSTTKKAKTLKAKLYGACNTGYFVAICNESIIGFIVLSKEEGKGDIGEICALYLLKEHQGKGFGKKMMDYVMMTFKNEGINKVVLWVLEKNMLARRFYEKYGFKKTEAKKNIYVGKTLSEVKYSLCIHD